MSSTLWKKSTPAPSSKVEDDSPDEAFATSSDDGGDGAESVAYRASTNFFYNVLF
jgi:hypothetical protein